MTPPPVRATRIVEVEALFHAALAEPDAHRAAYLDQHTAGDTALRRAVDRLLRADASDDGFLSEPALGPGFSLPSTEVLADGAAAQRIGPYQLIRPLGSGGMAHVWLARRADGQFDKDVAIKLIKRGMDTDAILDRFRAERQVLARLEHPNIARLLDGGATDDGLPFLAMEYVDGVAIDTYCYERGLPLRDRLALFRRVCAAVQYAHQNLVVHRDLKPGNILVTSAGEPKLLDFGIAKLLSADASPDTTVVAGEGRLLTPEYASPEQMAGQPITTASDLYSLGVVLYELLTGVSPYDSGAAAHDLRAQVLEVEPPRPSTRIRRERPRGIFVASASGQRPSWAAALQGDLDTIVMHALRKTPTARYASVEQLSDDIGRALDCVPIRARPGSWSYVARRFVQRHAGGVAAALVALFAVVSALFFSTSAYFRADAARQRELGQRQIADERRAEAESARRQAVAEATKLQATNAFLQQLLATDDPAVKLRADIELRELLAEASRALNAGALAGQPEVEAAVRITIGRTYTDLRIPNQGERHLRRAVEIQSGVFGPDSLLTADTTALLAVCLCEQSKFGEGIPLHRRALAVRRRLGTDESILMHRLSWLSAALRECNQLEEAESIAREALAIAERIPGPHEKDVAASRFRLGWILMLRGKLDEAEEALRCALADQQAILGSGHPNCGDTLLRLGQTLARKKGTDEAGPVMREAVRVISSALGPDHANTMRATMQLANFLSQGEKHAEAEALYSELVERYAAYYGYETGYVGATYAAHARLRARLGDLSGAEARLREAVRLFRIGLGERNPAVLETRLELCQILAREGCFAEAEQELLAAQKGAAVADLGSAAVRRTAEVAIGVYRAWGAAEPGAGHADRIDEWRSILEQCRIATEFDGEFETP